MDEDSSSPLRHTFGPNEIATIEAIVENSDSFGNHPKLFDKVLCLYLDEIPPELLRDKHGGPEPWIVDTLKSELLRDTESTWEFKRIHNC